MSNHLCTERSRQIRSPSTEKPGSHTMMDQPDTNARISALDNTTDISKNQWHCSFGD